MSYMYIHVHVLAKMRYLWYCVISRILQGLLFNSYCMLQAIGIPGTLYCTRTTKLYLNKLLLHVYVYCTLRVL